MQTEATFDFKGILKIAVVGGVVLLYLSLVGMITAFVGRDIIYKSLSLGFSLILITTFIFGYITARRTSTGNVGFGVLGGLITGIVSTGMLAILVILAYRYNIREVLINASDDLIEALTFGNENLVSGLLPLIAWGTLSSVLGAIIYHLPPVPRRALLAGLIMVVAVGTLEELVSDVIANFFELIFIEDTADVLNDLLFDKEGLSIRGTIIIFILSALIAGLWRWQGKKAQEEFTKMPAKAQLGSKITAFVIILILIIVLPNLLGSYLSEILVTVGIYTLMGFGLNIVVGFAGLLDLGYVAFFAIGAYTMGLLTSDQLAQTTELVRDGGMSFWAALPIAVGVSVLWGIILGVPVLRMRGDYLAIVTLGFGEIIRVLALSNFLQPKIGGAQGILGIPKPFFSGIELKTSQELYYLVLIVCILGAFISWRLRDSRSGRSWMAMREDEDVAEAVGINLIKTKLLAFAIGAGFSGFAGAIFAAKLGSIYPHSFNLLISINVLSLIIVGGIGSLPGVVVGSLALVGLPELLREFSEFRLLIFGALLVIMMLVRPEGLWPAAAQKRELHAADELIE